MNYLIYSFNALAFYREGKVIIIFFKFSEKILHLTFALFYLYLFTLLYDGRITMRIYTRLCIRIERKLKILFLYFIGHYRHNL